MAPSQFWHGACLSSTAASNPTRFLPRSTPMNPMFAFIEGMFSPMHILVVLVVGILLFGKRLPEVGRSLGKGIVEFKKGLNGLEDEVATGVRAAEPAAKELPRPPQKVSAPAPTFEESV